MAKKNDPRANLVTPHPKPQKRRLFLKEWRTHRDGMTQQRLADRAGVSQGMISQLENGQSDYTGELLEKLAYALRCDPADLIVRNPIDPEAPWSVWDRIKPEMRKRALQALKAFAEEEAA